MGEFPSGQRGQTVNLLLLASMVRIHPLPPSLADHLTMSVKWSFLCGFPGFWRFGCQFDHKAYLGDPNQKIGGSRAFGTEHKVNNFFSKKIKKFFQNKVWTKSGMFGRMWGQVWNRELHGRELSIKLYLKWDKRVSVDATPVWRVFERRTPD